MDSSLPATVITCSDRAFRDVYEDRSGPVLRDGLAAVGFKVDAPVIVPDDIEAIRAAVLKAVAAGARVVLTTGGTGVGPRDVTVGACAPLLHFQIPGITEAIRAAGMAKTPKAVLSRGLSGVIDYEGTRAVLVNVPGSRGGARDAMAVLKELLLHIIDQLDGADHPMD